MEGVRLDDIWGFEFLLHEGVTGRDVLSMKLGSLVGDSKVGYYIFRVQGIVLGVNVDILWSNIQIFISESAT